MTPEELERARAESRRAILKLRPIREIPVQDRPMYLRIVKELAREFANPSPRCLTFDQNGKLLEDGD